MKKRLGNSKYSCIDSNWRSVVSEAPTVPQHLQRMFFKKVGNSRPLFIYFCLFNKVDNKQVNKQMFNINFADDQSRTTDLWYQKRPLYKLIQPQQTLPFSHHPCVLFFDSLLAQLINQVCCAYVCVNVTHTHTCLCLPARHKISTLISNNKLSDLIPI